MNLKNYDIINPKTKYCPWHSCIPIISIITNPFLFVVKKI